MTSRNTPAAVDSGKGPAARCPPNGWRLTDEPAGAPRAWPTW